MFDGSGHRWPKRIRLDRKLYEIPLQIISITVSCRNRIPQFENDGFTNECRAALRHAADQRRIDVLAYCFMPDHLHLLLQPRNNTNVIDFLQRYKSYTAKLAWQYGIQGKIWQPSFYDHILRETDDPMKHIRYIIENPVRAELVRQWNDYPHIGSFVYDLRELDW